MVRYSVMGHRQGLLLAQTDLRPTRKLRSTLLQRSPPLTLALALNTLIPRLRP
jgi:hypothetical protein